ncbi:FecR family protein [soil metagenome]
MKSDKMDITDLLSSESFINYCKKSSTEDVIFWEKYLIENPSQQRQVELAKEKFLQLFNAMAASDLEEQVALLENRMKLSEPAPIIQMEGFGKRKSNHLLLLVIKITAVAAVLVAGTFLTLNYLNNNRANSIRSFVSAYGERKNIQLPDGSNVTLNAGSKIEINGTFGSTTRDVYLVGEAFFDVKHNAKLPFIVHTTTMDVKALGTAFDVKAYQNEKITETSLIRGIVEITLKESNNRIMRLYPNEKIQWDHSLATIENGNASTANNNDKLITTDSLMKKLAITNRGDIKEIAWKENKLIFDNDLFDDIAILLERWYGAKIEFKDEALRNYRFTATFEKEDLNTVLDFLKESRSFNYSIETGEITTVKLSK